MSLYDRVLLRGRERPETSVVLGPPVLAPIQRRCVAPPGPGSHYSRTRPKPSVVISPFTCARFDSLPAIERDRIVADDHGPKRPEASIIPGPLVLAPIERHCVAPPGLGRHHARTWPGSSVVNSLPAIERDRIVADDHGRKRPEASVVLGPLVLAPIERHRVAPPGPRHARNRPVISPFTSGGRIATERHGRKRSEQPAALNPRRGAATNLAARELGL